MAGIIDEGEVGGLGLAGDGRKFRLHGRQRLVDDDIDGKIELFEHGGDRLRVRDGVLQRRDRLVARHADHERHSLGRKGGRCEA